MNELNNDDDEQPEPDKHADHGSNEEYEVGYGNPPRHTQFKPGNKSSKGRPKGSNNFKTIVNAAFGVRVTAKINGKRRKMAKVELAMHQLANKASAGDLKAISKVVELYQMHGPQEEPGEITKEQSDYDLETIIHHLKVNGVIPWDVNDEESDDE